MSQSTAAEACLSCTKLRGTQPSPRHLAECLLALVRRRPQFQTVPPGRGTTVWGAKVWLGCDPEGEHTGRLAMQVV